MNVLNILILLANLISVISGAAVERDDQDNNLQTQTTTPTTQPSSSSLTPPGPPQKPLPPSSPSPLDTVIKAISECAKVALSASSSDDTSAAANNFQKCVTEANTQKRILALETIKFLVGRIEKSGDKSKREEEFNLFSEESYVKDQIIESNIIGSIKTLANTKKKITSKTFQEELTKIPNLEGFLGGNVITRLKKMKPSDLDTDDKIAEVINWERAVDEIVEIIKLKKEDRPGKLLDLDERKGNHFKDLSESLREKILNAPPDTSLSSSEGGNFELARMYASDILVEKYNNEVSIIRARIREKLLGCGHDNEGDTVSFQKCVSAIEDPQFKFSVKELANLNKMGPEMMQKERIVSTFLDNTTLKLKSYTTKREDEKKSKFGNFVLSQPEANWKMRGQVDVLPVRSKDFEEARNRLAKNIHLKIPQEQKNGNDTKTTNTPTKKWAKVETGVDVNSNTNQVRPPNPFSSSFKRINPVSIPRANLEADEDESDELKTDPSEPIELVVNATTSENLKVLRELLQSPPRLVSPTMLIAIVLVVSLVAGFLIGKSFTVSVVSESL